MLKMSDNICTTDTNGLEKQVYNIYLNKYINI